MVCPHGDKVEVTRQSREEQERIPLKEGGRGTWACHKGRHRMVKHH